MLNKIYEMLQGFILTLEHETCQKVCPIHRNPYFSGLCPSNFDRSNN